MEKQYSNFSAPVISYQVVIKLAFFICLASFSHTRADILYDNEIPQLAFAAAEIEKAIDQDIRSEIELSVAPPDAMEAGFLITVRGDSLKVVGANATEAMYGGLEIAERLRFGDDISALGSIRRQPYIANRGLKFNIPLDARTPSYDDSGDAAQRNIAEMWSMEFWTEFLDQMARDRYNMLSLWNPHPFPSMITLEEYPEVALDDVCVTTLTPNGRENEWGGPQLVSTNVVANLRTVKKIAIEEKIDFWRTVMRHAKHRGIAIYFITWNICPNSVAKPVAPYYRTYDNPVTDDEPRGKHGVTHEITNPATKRYMRAAVKQFVLTYPDLAGIGITAGEHMPLSSDLDREKWLWETYGLGILDAKREQPERHVRFIHRMWNTDMAKIVEPWKDYPDTFDLSFKYARARLYSSPNIPFADELIEQMKPYQLKSWWNLRNDDIFVHRWGDPDYVRAFIKHFDLASTAGFHMGSDGYVWGREFVSKNPNSPRELEIKKHWYSFMLWGRLGYDPDLEQDFFIARLADRFPDADASQLYQTWQFASKIVPLVNRFYWRNWDFMWSVENSNSHDRGFIGVERFCDNQPMQDSGLQAIRALVKARLEEKPLPGITPLQVADQLEAFANDAREQAQALLSKANGGALRATLDDCIGMSWLGEYYANKIRSAVALATYQVTHQTADLNEALVHIQAAYESCTRYVDHSQARYHPQMLARTGLFSWSAMLNNARQDVAYLKDLQRDNSGN